MMLKKGATEFLRKHNLEMRYVVVEECNGSYWEDVLPAGTKRATALEKTKEQWDYLTTGEKKTTVVYLIKIVCDKNGNTLIDEELQELLGDEKEKIYQLEIDTYYWYNPLKVYGGTEE